jgi:hypothetical protein
MAPRHQPVPTRDSRDAQRGSFTTDNAADLEAQKALAVKAARRGCPSISSLIMLLIISLVVAFLLDIFFPEECVIESARRPA